MQLDLVLKRSEEIPLTEKMKSIAPNSLLINHPLHNNARNSDGILEKQSLVNHTSKRVYVFCQSKKEVLSITQETYLLPSHDGLFCFNRHICIKMHKKQKLKFELGNLVFHRYIMLNGLPLIDSPSY